MAVTGIDVSYGSALVPAPYKRLVKRGAEAVNVQAIAGCTPVYIWIKRTADVDPPIVDIALLYDDEPVPESYKKVTRDLSAGTGEGRSYIAYRHTPLREAAQIVLDVTVVGEIEVVDAGYTVLGRSLTRVGPPLRLAVQYGNPTQLENSPANSWAESVKVDDIVDVLDKYDIWRSGRIVAASPDGGEVTVSVTGIAGQTEEKVPRSARRLARPSTRRNDKWYFRQGEVLDISMEMLDTFERKIDAVVVGDFPLEHKANFMEGELPQFVQQVLSAKYDSDEMRDRINRFNQKVMHLCVHCLKLYEEPLPPEIVLHLRRLFLDDHNCDYFFQHYGGIQPQHELAAITNGWASRLPSGGASRYYVANMNQFYSLGGYDAILGRLRYANAVARSTPVGTDKPVYRAAVPVRPSGTNDTTVPRSQANANGSPQTGTPAASMPSASPASSVASDAGTDDPLLEASLFATLLWIPRLCYTRDWALKYYAAFRDACLDRVLSLTDAQLKRMNRDHVENIKTQLIRLGRALILDLSREQAACVIGHDDLQTPLDNFTLQLSIRMLRCDSLALRVKAVSDIRDIVEAVEDDGLAGLSTRAHKGAVLNPRGPANHFAHPRRLTPEKLATWLTENQVVNILLGDKLHGDRPSCPIHVQTLSRLSTLLTFLIRVQQRQTNESRVANVDAGSGFHPVLERGAQDDTENNAVDQPEAAAAAVEYVTSRHIDLLFKCLEDDSDAIRRAVFDIVAAMSNFLPLELVNKVYSQLALIPFAKYDDVTITTVKNFTIDALKLSETHRSDAYLTSDSCARVEPSWDEDVSYWYGLRELWHVCHNVGPPSTTHDAVASAPVDVRTVNAAVDAIVMIIKDAPVGYQLFHLVRLCFDDIRDNASVYTSVLLAFHLLRLVSSKRPSSGPTTLAQFLSACDARYNIVRLLVTDMHRYKAAAAVSASARHGSSEVCADVGHGAIFVGSHTHLDNVNTRLEFLRWVMEQTKSVVDLEALRMMWNAFVVGALVDEERSIFFRWLASCVCRSGPAGTAPLFTFGVLSAELCKQIFSELFCSSGYFALADVDKAAYDAFELFFRLTNGTPGRLLGWYTPDFWVVDPELAGMRQLWAIFISSTSRDVTIAAAHLLIAVAVRLQLSENDGAVAVVNRKRSIWEQFVARCMDTVSGAVANIDGSCDGQLHKTACKTIGKVLELLTAFLAEMDEAARAVDDYEPAKLEHHAIRISKEGKDDPSPLCVCYDYSISLHLGDSKSQQHVKIAIRPKLETVGTVRNRLADVFQVAADRVRLGTTSRAVRWLGNADDDRTIDSLRIHDSMAGEICEESRVGDPYPHRYLTREERTYEQLRLKGRLQDRPANEVESEIAAYRQLKLLAAQAATAPRDMLSTRRDYFDLLFSLLSIQSSNVVLDAWNLLQLLPVNPKVQNDIRTLSGTLDGSDAVARGPAASPRWAEIFDGQAPLKLLYSLQILSRWLEELTATAPDVAAVGTAAEATARSGGPVDVTNPWCKAFVREGGLAHLQSLLMTMNFTELLASMSSAHLMKECGRMLLLTFQRLIISNGPCLRRFSFDDDDTAAGFRVDRLGLLRRLLELLSLLTGLGKQLAARMGSWPPDIQSHPSGRPQRQDITFPSPSSSGIIAPTHRRLPTAHKIFDDDDDLGIKTVFSAHEDDEFEQADGSRTGKPDDMRAGHLPIEAQLVESILQLLAVTVLAPEVDAYRTVQHLDDQNPSSWNGASVHSGIFSILYGFPGIDDVIMSAILAADDGAIRSITTRELMALCDAYDQLLRQSPSLRSDPVPSPSTYLLQMMMRNISRAYLFPDRCSNYFDLLTHLIGSYDGDRHLPFDEEAAISRVARLLWEHPIVEVGSDPRDAQDAVLQGLLSTLRHMVKDKPALKLYAGSQGGCNLVEEVFENCLFAMPMMGGAGGKACVVESVLGGRLPRCKAYPSRKAAFALLTELSVGCLDNALALCSRLLPHHDEQSAVEGIGVQSRGRAAPPVANQDDDDDKAGRFVGMGSTVGATSAPGKSAGNSMSGRSKNLAQPRSSTGYVGLRNLGCICYMNATMQQFFMCPQFRRGVLSWQEPSTDESGRANSIMFQMQRQFAFLQESEKQYYNPKGLCHAIKDWDGNPTDVTEQKDVPEFLTKLFADMETQCQGSPLQSLVKDVYGGQTLQELIAEDPRANGRPRLYATKIDEYMFLQMHIKNNKNLVEALNEFVAGESVDYKWSLPPDADAAGVGLGVEPAGTKSEEVMLRTVRRVSLKAVGSHLMLHLSRFEFDYENMQQIKLNDRFEFPRLLDMWPYTVYGRPDAVADNGPNDGSTSQDKSQYQYELVGIVIHMGTAIGGHYYSYIRERDEYGPSSHDRWLEFNDMIVKPWEATDAAMDRDCFGGSERIQTSYPVFNRAATGFDKLVTSTSNVYERTRSANAFCLFYDRIVPRAQIESDAVADYSSSVDTMNPGGENGASTEGDYLRTFIARMRQLYGAGTDRVRIRVRAAIPSSIFCEIQEDNLQFWRLRTIYELDYFSFVQSVVRAVAAIIDANDTSVLYPWSVVQSTEETLSHGGPTMPAIQLVVAFMMNTLTDSNQKFKIPEWIDILTPLLKRNAVACVWQLQSALADSSAFFGQMVNDANSTEASRNILARLCTIAIQTLWPVEQMSIDSIHVSVRTVHWPVWPGTIVVSFIALLLSWLPELHVHWRRFQGVFAVLQNFCMIDAAARLRMLQIGALGKLIDFALGGDSPHPELNQAYSAPTLSILNNGDPPAQIDDKVGAPSIHYVDKVVDRRMGDTYNQPDFDSLLDTVKMLITSSLPPSGVVGSPYTQKPSLPLSQTDEDMVTCRQFLREIVSQLTTGTTARHHRSMITHLFWGADIDDETEPLLDFGKRQLVRLAAHVIYDHLIQLDYDEIRPAFRFVGLICDVCDDASRQHRRVDMFMSNLTNAVLSQTKYYRFMEVAIELLLKLARSRPLVIEWLGCHPDVLARLHKWLLDNDRPPAATPQANRFVNDEQVRMFKRTTYGYYGYANHTVYDEPLIQNVKLMMNGRLPFFDAYESDDEPESAVGRRVRISISSQHGKPGRVVSGVITRYQPASGEHVVRFEDGLTERNFNLLEFRSYIVRFIKDGPLQYATEAVLPANVMQSESVAEVDINSNDDLAEESSDGDRSSAAEGSVTSCGEQDQQL